MRLLILTAILVLGTSFKSLSQTVTVIPKDSVIVLDSKADKIKAFAARELAKHLKLITGVNIPIVKKKISAKYAFYVGATATGEKRKLKPEESCYIISSKATWFYGDDKAFGRSPVFHPWSHTGTLFAVYNFLDRELGVKWIEPGDNGIVFKAQKTLPLTRGSYDWIPKLPMREIRRGYYMKNANIPKAFQLSQNEVETKKMEIQLWLKRMRMGKRRHFSYGHAFTNWWKEYGKKHPEYFALNKYGKRSPRYPSKPHTIKMCVSNPRLHKQIVENWLKTRGKQTVINVCENDSGGYCRCNKCKALDVPRKGEKFGTVMTDRYIHFANKVQRLARKKVPNAQTVMYAYSVYRFPPRKVKVDDGVILGFVPKLFTSYNKLEEYYKSWHRAGARNLFLRPNDMHIDLGLPMGFEKKMFDNFKICLKYGAFGTDYDSLHNYWPTSGIANYIIARAVAEPEKLFEFWENEYCNTFGKAADDIKKYFAYWRNEIWEKRLMPDRETIIKKGRYGNFRRGLMWNIQNYYKKVDFDKTDKMLQNALKKELSPAELKRVETLVLANKHARLLYQALKAKNARPTDIQKIHKAAKALVDFRIKNKTRLNYDWRSLFFYEYILGDVCGIEMTKFFDGLSPIKALRNRWYFQIDAKNAGLKEKWQEFSYSRIKASWDTISTSSSWEQASVHPDLKKIMKNYDGIGWYAQKIIIPQSCKNKKLYLLFGAVDESCWIYINGKEVGKHLHKKPDDWKTPFKIRIDKEINWQNPTLTIVVRVEDKGGAGGIWQPVWLVNAK